MKRLIWAIKDEIETWPHPFSWGEIIEGLVILALIIFGVWGLIKGIQYLCCCGG